MFSLGQQAEKVRSIPFIPKLKEDNVRKGVFTHFEYLRLRKVLPERLRPVVAFAYYTGMRKSEILKLQWSQVDLNEGKVRLEPGTTKNNEPRTVPLPRDLLEELKRQRKTRDQRCPGCRFVFFHHDTGLPIRDFRGSWATATKESSLEGRLFHDFRRTGVRNLIRAGVPERVAMAISGHKTRSVFDRYNIVDEEDLREASEKVHEYLRAKEDSIRRKVVNLSEAVVAPKRRNMRNNPQ